MNRSDKSEGEAIETLLRKGNIEQGYQGWKQKDFEFLKNLGAGTNFYYLRQILMYSEQKNQESCSEAKTMLEEYEKLQAEYQKLLNDKSSFEYKETEVTII